METLNAVLFAWALNLTGYAESQPPAVEQVSHRALTEMACGGRECRVMGWFPPGNTVYVDDRLDFERSTYHASVLVHEQVHYLQQQSGRWQQPYRCADLITMEREAYATQSRFLVAFGVYQPVGVSMHGVDCPR